MNAFLVNAEALGGFNRIGDPIIRWDLLDETKPAVGYAFAWELTNGFAKVAYWSKKKCADHAGKYSQMHRGHLGRNQAKSEACKWCTEFDAMALKTVVVNSLRRWGIMAIETGGLTQALERDPEGAFDAGTGYGEIAEPEPMREPGDEDEQPDDDPI